MIKALAINVLYPSPADDIPISIIEKCIDFLPDAILAIDLEGRVIAWNPAMEKMTGARAVDMIGRGNYEYALPFYGIRRPIALGAMGGAKYEERRVDLSSGDVLVLYTDGVNEAENRNGEQYGIERFRCTVSKSCQHSAQRILDKILADLSQFCEGQAQFDDITMVVVRAM